MLFIAYEKQVVFDTMSSDEFKKEKIGLGMAIVKGLIAV